MGTTVQRPMQIMMWKSGRGTPALPLVEAVPRSHPDSKTLALPALKRMIKVENLSRSAEALQAPA